MSKTVDNENSFFGGFEAIVDGLARVNRSAGPGPGKDPDDGFETITEINSGIDVLPITGDDPIVDKTVKEPIKKGKKQDGLQVKKEEEIEEIEETVIDEEDELVEPDDEPSATPVTGDTTELGEYETDVVDFFVDRFTNELGWELDEESKPKSVNDVVEYLKNIVETNSKPQYASEDIERLNDYVANGGDLRSFYQEVYDTPNFDSLDIESESVQKKILTDNFKRLGYTPEKINRFISRYEDAGTLQDEAEDALESLKEYKTKRAEQLLVEQENARKESLNKQQKFYKDVYTSIEKTDSIRGVQISAKEKKELAEYIFKPEADGLTRYQKDYAKDYRNLIESAYFTMKGDSLIQKVTQKATSQAAKNLQDKLANKGKRVKNSGITHGSQSSTLAAWDTVSKQLRRPNF